MTKEKKTHYRKAFKSLYLNSADIVSPTDLTILHVLYESDKTKRTQKNFNTAYFTEKEIRPGEPFRPMILNVGHCEILQKFTKSYYLEDWVNILVTIYVNNNVKYKLETVDGLRLRLRPSVMKKLITPSDVNNWNNVKKAYLRDENFDNILKRANISQLHQKQLISECANS